MIVYQVKDYDDVYHFEYITMGSFVDKKDAEDYAEILKNKTDTPDVIITELLVTEPKNKRQ